MTRNTGGIFELDDGPGKFDIVESLADTANGVRTVQFRLAQSRARYHVEITSATRHDKDGVLWTISGLAKMEQGMMRVSLMYHSHNRTGTMMFVAPPEPPAVSLGEQKSDVLIKIIHEMIAEYRQHNAGQLSEEIFRLVDLAKQTSWAPDGEALDRIITAVNKK